MVNYTLSPTFRLCPPPSFWDGVVAALDVAHTLPEFNLSGGPAEADKLAVASDWMAVYGDMKAALDSVVKHA